MKRYWRRLWRRKLPELAVYLFLGLGIAYISQRVTKSEPRYSSGFVTHVYDGDTIKITSFLGTEKVRLIGIDTPELHHPKKGREPYGEEARDYTHRYLLEKEVFLEYDVEYFDQFDRRLAYVWLKDPSEKEVSRDLNNLFNYRLVREGYARAVRYGRNIKHQKKLKKAQFDAKKEFKGIWKK